MGEGYQPIEDSDETGVSPSTGQENGVSHDFEMKMEEVSNPDTNLSISHFNKIIDCGAGKHDR